MAVYRMSKKVQAWWEKIEDGAVLVQYRNAMGHASYRLRKPDGDIVVMPNIIADQLLWPKMRKIAEPRYGVTEWAIR